MNRRHWIGGTSGQTACGMDIDSTVKGARSRYGWARIKNKCGLCVRVLNSVEVHIKRLKELGLL